MLVKGRKTGRVKYESVANWDGDLRGTSFVTWVTLKTTWTWRTPRHRKRKHRKNVKGTTNSAVNRKPLGEATTNWVRTTVVQVAGGWLIKTSSKWQVASGKTGNWQPLETLSGKLCQQFKVWPNKTQGKQFNQQWTLKQLNSKTNINFSTLSWAQSSSSVPSCLPNNKLWPRRRAQRTETMKSP